MLEVNNFSAIRISLASPDQIREWSKGEEIQPPRVPESFKVLIKELRSLGLNAEILDQNEEEIPLAEDDASGYLLPDLGGINLAGFED